MNYPSLGRVPGRTSICIDKVKSKCRKLTESQTQAGDIVSCYALTMFTHVKGDFCRTPSQRERYTKIFPPVLTFKSDLNFSCENKNL
jgi:hypothetical protein